MIFEVNAETARWIQKTISRMRCKDDWSSATSRDACWTPAFLSAMVDEVDYLLTSSLAKAAFEISKHLQLLAERIRASDCPQKELGKRSLIIWAMAVHASSCRASGRFDAAESLFRAAFDRAEPGVLDWALGDLDRRFAVLLLQRGDQRAFDWINRALPAFARLPERSAETLLLRGAAYLHLDQNSPKAIADFTAAASLVVSLTSERARWNLNSACHNLAGQLVVGYGHSFEDLGHARKLLHASRRFFGQGMSPRKLTSIWVEGLLVFRFGWNRHAERLIERARQGFLKFDLRDDYLIATLDLVLILTEDGESEKAKATLISAAKFLKDRFADAPEYCACWQPNLGIETLLAWRQELTRDLLRPPRRKVRAQGSSATAIGPSLTE